MPITLDVYNRYRGRICPQCSSGDAIKVRASELVGEMTATFTCENCGFNWSVKYEAVRMDAIHLDGRFVYTPRNATSSTFAESAITFSDWFRWQSERESSPPAPSHEPTPPPAEEDEPL